MGQEHKVRFSIVGLVANTFRSAVGMATSSLGDLNKKVKGLESKQKNVNKFSGLRNDIKKTANEFHEAQAKCKKLKLEMDSTSKPTAALKREFASAKSKSAKLKNSLNRQVTGLKKLKGSLKSAGINTKNLSAESRKLASDIDRARKAEEKLQKRVLRRKKGKQFRENVRGKAVAVGGAALALAGMGASHAKVASAQGEVASLGIDAEGIKKISAEATKFSDTWSGTSAPDFIRASYDIKSGVSSLSDLSVAKFTSMAALTGKATKATTGEMTTLFAKGYGVYSKEFGKFGSKVIKGWNTLSQEEKDLKFGEAFSAGIATSVQLFRTDGSQMSQAISSLGSAATSAGYSMQEQFAVLGKLQQTFSGSESATKLRAFIKGANKAGKELNLDFTDPDTGKLKSIPEILEEIKGKYGELDADEADSLTKAFGSDEASSFISSLINNTDDLKSNTDAIAKNMSGGLGPTKAMAQAMNKGPGERWGVAAQSVENLTASIGQGFAPVSIVLADAIGSVASNLRVFIDANPTLTAGVMGVGAVVVGATGALLALGYAMSFSSHIGTGYGLVVKGLTLAKKALSLTTMVSTARLWIHAAAVRGVAVAQRAFAIGTKLATAAQWLLNAALTANPIGLVVVGVAALIGLAVLLYKKFKPFRDLVNFVWAKIKKIIKYGARLLGFAGKTTPKVTSADPAKTRKIVSPPYVEHRRFPQVRKEAVEAGSYNNKVNYSPKIIVNAPGADVGEIERRTNKAVQLSAEEFKKTQDEINANEDRIRI
ncbi:MAG: phage tail tape measure protein [Desulfobacterales bacterium]|nr:phage tail tape measure protein [Desulfobacterales bacterium]